MWERVKVWDIAGLKPRHLTLEPAILRVTRVEQCILAPGTLGVSLEQLRTLRGTCDFNAKTQARLDAPLNRLMGSIGGHC